jgi:hypothetical protein
MSSGKANPATLLKEMHRRKKNVTQSGREPTPNPLYPNFGGAGGGRGVSGWGGVDFDPPPSASSGVAPELLLEGSSRADESDSRHELEVMEEEDEEEARPKNLKTRAESRVPEERKEPKTQEAKARIIPDGVE